MERFSQFGVEPLLLAAQIINFFVLLYLLKRFLYKPILAVLKKREEKIREGLAAGVKGEELLMKAKKEEKEILAQANDEAGVLLEGIRQHSAKMEEEMLARAKEESGELLAHAKIQIEEERRVVEKDLSNRAVQTAVGILEGVLPKVLSKQDQVRILERSQKTLQKVLTS